MDPQKRKSSKNKTYEGLQQNFSSYQLPMYEQGWSIYLQIVLLDALEMFGSENWQMAANYLNSDFQAEDIRDHYYRIYGNHNQGQSYLKESSLLDNEQYDPYIAAHAYDKLRRQNERRQQKKLEIEKEQIPKLNIPSQFGYEGTKKLFGQSYNQQAEIMILGLRIQDEDSIQMKESKLEVLKLYSKMVKERSVIQKQVIQDNLIQCKYRLTNSNLVIPKDLQESEGQNKQIRKGRRSKQPTKQSLQKKMNKRDEFIQNQIMFRIKRALPEKELSQGLHVTYMKVAKFDEKEKLKGLLKKFHKLSSQLKDQKEKIKNSQDD